LTVRRCKQIALFVVLFSSLPSFTLADNALSKRDPAKELASKALSTRATIQPPILWAEIASENTSWPFLDQNLSMKIPTGLANAGVIIPGWHDAEMLPYPRSSLRAAETISASALSTSAETGSTWWLARISCLRERQRSSMLRLPASRQAS